MKDLSSNNKKNTYICAIIHVYGLVQGVGYRPYIAIMANSLKIRGNVINLGGIVKITAFGKYEAIHRFVDSLKVYMPKGARVDNVVCNYKEYNLDYNAENNAESNAENNVESNVESNAEVIKILKEDRFTIEESDSKYKEKTPFIPTDISTCEACEKELFNKKSRRYYHPFISCVACGPRYSIIYNIPYDRDNLTMKEFNMCKECYDEYVGNKPDEIENRYFAQTIACNNCGPKLKWRETDGWDKKVDNAITENVNNTIIEQGVNTLLNGGIIAIKDIGGYHLACMAENMQAVSDLRKIKGREEKPFAVMFRNIAAAKEYCSISEKEIEVMTGKERPIVLLKKKKEFIGDVCGNFNTIGGLLPCNPLQMLITYELYNKVQKEIPLVMTSANLSGESIIIEDNKMLTWIDRGLDGVLYHNRKILCPLDDSIVKIINDKVQIIRRARGYVPSPIVINKYFEEGVLAVGGDLKASFALIKENKVYFSQYFGDLDSEEIYNKYKNEYERLSRLLNITPKKIVCDMHPGYISKKFANEIAKKENIKVYEVQHHYAHGASVIGEHGLTGRIIGVVFDGTGYGVDGNIWGGEFLLYSNKDNSIKVKRVGHLKEVKLVGGDGGAKNSKTIMYGYLWNLINTLGGKVEQKSCSTIDLSPCWRHVDGCKNQITGIMDSSEFNIISKALSNDLNTVLSTSAGRLFDGVSALLGISSYNNYEGQSAIELECRADKSTVEKTDLVIPVKNIGTEKENVCCDSGNNAEDTENTENTENTGDAEDTDKIENTDSNIMLEADTLSLFKQIYERLVKVFEEPKKDYDNISDLAKEFHLAIINMIIEVCRRLSLTYKTDLIVLSGGTFQNKILLEGVVKGLTRENYKVYFNEQVPPGDGGLALGQGYLVSDR